tara:strand:- start:57 stop:1076 length:1020 start_codon:yes stop_codon:yes gene_type:complete
MRKKPFFIAEISANHNGNLSLAKKLIKCAKSNEADAVKIQTYTADSMTIKSSKKYFKIKEGLWKGYDLWSLYDKAHTPRNWHRELFEYAKSVGIEIFSTPFDIESVDFLESLNCSRYKIASFEMTDLDLVKRVAKTNKPIIISTGMASLEEISESYLTAKKSGAKDITLLYCVSNYPAVNEDFNINNIKILKKKFGCRIGFSDHSKNTKIALAAIASGAEVIEKHIALSNQKKGFDLEFSLKGKQIKNFRNEINEAYKIMGHPFFYRNKSEDDSKIFRRSVFVVKKIRKGELFSTDNLRVIRPGYGVAPKFMRRILNKECPENLTKGDPITERILKKIL